MARVGGGGVVQHNRFSNVDKGLTIDQIVSRKWLLYALVDAMVRHAEVGIAREVAKPASQRRLYVFLIFMLIFIIQTSCLKE